MSVGLAAINRGGGLLKSAASAHLQSPFKSLAHTTLYTATAAQQRTHSELRSKKSNALYNMHFFKNKGEFM